MAVLVALVTSSGAARADTPTISEPLARALRDELARSMTALRLPDSPAPYYVAYQLTDTTSFAIGAAYGAITTNWAERGRRLHVDVRVGDRKLDSSRFASWDDMFSSLGDSSEHLPLDDDYDVIQHDVWSATDRSYKQAATALARKRAALATQAAVPDAPDDFSEEPKVQVSAPHATSSGDVERAASLVKVLSAMGRAYPDIQSCNVVLRGERGRQLYLSSEGTQAEQDVGEVVLHATLRTQAPDGMPLSRELTYAAKTLEALPSREAIQRDVELAAAELTQQRSAPETEEYVGPVLFEARAAATLVREVLATQLVGTPTAKVADSSRRAFSRQEAALAGRVGEKVLASALIVEDDPTIDTFAGLPLVGGYAVDDEGVRGQRVTLIEGGTLKALLMSRAPRKGMPHSNGHGRRTLFGTGEATLSNLLVRPTHPKSVAELKRALLAEAKAAGRSYAIIVRLLEDAGTGGRFTSPFGSRSADAPVPLALVKVTLDGKEQLLRGGTLSPFPLRAFEEIVAAGGDFAVASGAGMISSSVVSPALLFKRVDIKKPTGPQTQPPVVPAP
jgi:predicted Zn-dependent protease